MYVMALRDYEPNDWTSLSFRKGDIITVAGGATQFKSGWGHGIINSVRGWFPSNYCKLISEPPIHVQEEAEEESLEGYDDEYEEEEEEEVVVVVVITKLREKKRMPSDWIPMSTPDGKLYL
jgi:son of sevenless-like protein